MKGHRLLGLSLLFAILFVGVAAAENLQDAYQQAVATDRTLAQAQAQLRADRQGAPLARSAFLPHLGVAANYGAAHAHITGFGALPPITEYYRSDGYSVTLTETLFNGQSFATLKQASSRIYASQAALAYAKQQLALQVATAYFSVLEAQAEQRVIDRQEKLLNVIYKQAQTALKVGSGDIITVEEARASLVGAQANIIKATNTTAIAENTLARLTHHPVGVLAGLGHFRVLGPHPDRVGPWIKVALRQDPLLLQARAQLRTAEEQVNYAQRARWPQVFMQGFAYHSLGSPLPGFDNNQYGVSVNVAMPIFNGGGISASVRQAQAQAQAQVDHVGNVQDNVTLAVQTAFLNLQNSVMELKAAKETRCAAKVSLHATRKGYQIGARSIVDLLTTATDYLRAEQDYNVALYDQVVSRVQLKAAAGILTAGDIHAINALLVGHTGS